MMNWRFAGELIRFSTAWPYPSKSSSVSRLRQRLDQQEKSPAATAGLSIQ
jgi:hypothetical protein